MGCCYASALLKRYPFVFLVILKREIFYYKRVKTKANLNPHVVTKMFKDEKNYIHFIKNTVFFSKAHYLT